MSVIIQVFLLNRLKSHKQTFQDSTKYEAVFPSPPPPAAICPGAQWRRYIRTSYFSQWLMFVSGRGRQRERYKPPMNWHAAKQRAGKQHSGNMWFHGETPLRLRQSFSHKRYTADVLRQSHRPDGLMVEEMKAHWNKAALSIVSLCQMSLLWTLEI